MSISWAWRMPVADTFRPWFGDHNCVATLYPRSLAASRLLMWKSASSWASSSIGLVADMAVSRIEALSVGDGRNREVRCSNCRVILCKECDGSEIVGGFEVLVSRDGESESHDGSGEVLAQLSAAPARAKLSRLSVISAPDWDHEVVDIRGIMV